MTPDPTRSGALWVGGAGVALLLAAAGVLTAVRWDDIGQSIKLGGLVAITLALLTAGQRLKHAIPMTAQAIFHLGALLIPFDVAAVAILAGRSWQETLMLTALTSVVAWYAISTAVPSMVLRWCATGAVVALAAGVASLTPMAMPFALALAAAAALLVRKPTEAGLWAALAGVLPLASFVEWPVRIAGAMADLGFVEGTAAQHGVAGVMATVTLSALTRISPRPDFAAAAIVTAFVTVLVALVDAASVNSTFVALAAVFVAVEALAFATRRDPLWAPILKPVAIAIEIGAAYLTALLLAHALSISVLPATITATTIIMAASLVAFAWLIADWRRLDEVVGPLPGLLVGSDWPVTTVLFPAAVLAAVFAASLPPLVGALIALGVAYWMVATWRTSSAFGAIVLAATAAVIAHDAPAWPEFGAALVTVAVLTLAAHLGVRAKDSLSTVSASVASMALLLLSSESLVVSYQSRWPLVLVIAVAWLSTWAIEVRKPSRVNHVAELVGRLTALAVAGVALSTIPLVGLAACVAVVALSMADYYRLSSEGLKLGDTRLTALAVVGGAAIGLSFLPLSELAGLGVAEAGVAMAVASFVLVGLALVAPQRWGVHLGSAAITTGAVGVALASAESSPFSLALMAAGCSVAFVAVALRDWVTGIAGYATVAVGASLQLTVWEVTWIEPYLVFPAVAALAVGYRYHRSGGSSWAAYAPTIAVFGYVSIAERLSGGSAWHAVIAGAVAIAAIIAGGYRRLAGPLLTGSAILTVVVGYELLGPAALIPTWAWLAAGGTILLAAGVAMERSDTTPLERGQQVREVIASQFT